MIALATERPLAGGFTRRGACPALSAPMLTGDGLLVRLNPIAGGLKPGTLIGLCEAAGTHGNGVIEVTARGSLQVRGLTERSAGLFAQVVDAIGIPVRTGVPVQTSVLAGIDPEETADPTKLAEAIRAGIADAGLDGRLGPKVSVVVDGGGRTALDEVATDVRLTAIGDGGWRVAIAGDARTARLLGSAGGDQAACDVALALLAKIAGRGHAARARDLDDVAVSAIANSLEIQRSTLPPSGLPAISPTRGEITPSSMTSPISGAAEGRAAFELPISPLVGEMAGRPEGGVAERGASGSLIGSFGLRDGNVARGVALPFGHTNADTLKTFGKISAKLGIDDIRPAPKRTLVAICATPAQAEALRKQAETLGFITSSDDPRQAISACPGAPDCASGHIPARTIAAEIASGFSALLDGSLHLHISGCAKGCAHPAAAGLVLVGSDAGMGLVVGATARHEPAALADSDGARRAFANMASLVSAQRRAGETTAQTLKRLGLSMLAKAFEQGEK